MDETGPTPTDGDDAPLAVAGALAVGLAAAIAAASVVDSWRASRRRRTVTRPQSPPAQPIPAAGPPSTAPDPSPRDRAPTPSPQVWNDRHAPPVAPPAPTYDFTAAAKRGDAWVQSMWSGRYVPPAP
jgi:hypothetical protein